MRYAGHDGSASRGSIIVAEKKFNRIKTELSQKYNIPLDPVKEQSVAEGDRPGMKDGRPYSDPLRRHPGNDSYMTPEYLIQKYQDELKKIAAGPYKRPKDVAMYQARIAKLQRQQGVAEGFPKDPNAPKLVRDRKTGKQYDPNKEFEKKMNSPEVMAQMKRMAQKEGVAEDHEIQMASSELQSIAKNAVNLLSLVRKYSEQEGLDAWQQSKITKAADYLNSVLQSINGEQSNMESDAYMESLQNMLERSVSQAQHNLMVGVAHNPAFAQKVKVKQKVGQEFARADQGHDISKLPIRVPKKK
jgi:hypothetical protein